MAGSVGVTKRDNKRPLYKNVRVKPVFSVDPKKLDVSEL